MNNKSNNIVLRGLQGILKSGIITWILLLAIWQIASTFNSPEFFPSPLKTWEGFVEILKKGVLWQDIQISMQRVAIGWLSGLVWARNLKLY